VEALPNLRAGSLKMTSGRNSPKVSSIAIANGELNGE